jgi:membrane fusion protein (multidrug efflux system)
LTPGKKVALKMDAYPDIELTGTVASLSEATGAKFALLPPDNSSGNFVKVTQRVPVKIWIDDLEKHRELLRAGLSISIVAPTK